MARTARLEITAVVDAPRFIEPNDCVGGVDHCLGHERPAPRLCRPPWQALSQWFCRKVGFSGFFGT
jgi:hypothetical protein